MSEHALDAVEDDEVTRAIELAKSYIRKVYKAERIENLGLEEVVETDGPVWDITLGFSRAWDLDTSILASAMAFQRSPKTRTYKVVRVNTQENKAVSVKNRAA